MAQVNIALLHLYSNGDCLFASIVVRQIKKDFPGCKLTWFVGVQSKGMLLNNPNIDEIVEIDARGEKGIQVWHHWNEQLQERTARGEFDHYFSTQIIWENEKNYCGSIRASILKNYPRKIEVSLTPDLFLTDTEIKHVEEVVTQWELSRFKNIVLFECAPVSRQIPIDPKIATGLSEQALSQLKDTCIILTSGEKIQTQNPALFDASVLSIRENAALINYCTHLIGCSSGISWMSISNACKRIPTLQFLSNKSFYYNSMKRDFRYLNLNSEHIIETEFSAQPQKVVADMQLFITDYQKAFAQLNKELPDRSTTVYSLSRTRILNGKTAHAFRIIGNCFKLNAGNPHYYYLILKLLLLYPFYQYLRFRKEVLKEHVI